MSSDASSEIVSVGAPRFCGECGRALKAVSHRMGFDRQTGCKQIDRRLRCPHNHEDWAPISDGTAYVNLGPYWNGFF